MPSLPRSRVSAVDGRRSAGFSGSTETLLVAGCCSAGNTMDLRLYTDPDALVADRGVGVAVEAAAHIIDTTGKRVLFCRLPSSTAGSLSAVDSNDATGTSVLTVAGTVYDSLEYRIQILTAGTIGVAGITYRYSRDGGRTWSLELALGTASTYLIPGTGCTVTFGAGTVVLDDEHRWTSTEPRWVAQDLTDLLDAAAANNVALRGALLCGDLVPSEVDTLNTALEAYATDHDRPQRWFGNIRRARLDRRARGTLSLTFAEVGASGDTITRASGSWITDGFVTGDNVSIAGSTLNDRVYTNVTVTSATVLTLDSNNDVAAEGPVTCTATASEDEEEWIADAGTDFAAKVAGRLSLWAGHGLMVSAVTAAQNHRPSSWAGAARFLSVRLSRSLAAKMDGALVGWSIVDEHGDLVDHDERAVEGLLDGRFACLRTFDGNPGVYVALPMLFAATGSDFDRLHLGAVADLVCVTARAKLEDKLGEDVLGSLADPTHIDEQAAQQIEFAVNEALRRAVISPGHATSAVYTCSRTDDLASPPRSLTGKVRLDFLLYIEDASTAVQVNIPISVGVA